jgi:hypothetical protein
MIRFVDRETLQEARAAFRHCLNHSRAINPEEWSKERSLWRRLKQHWAYFLLVRIDPYIAQRQWRALPD